MTWGQPPSAVRPSLLLGSGWVKLWDCEGETPSRQPAGRRRYEKLPSFARLDSRGPALSGVEGGCPHAVRTDIG